MLVSISGLNQWNICVSATVPSLDTATMIRLRQVFIIGLTLGPGSLFWNHVNFPVDLLCCVAPCSCWDGAMFYSLCRDLGSAELHPSTFSTSYAHPWFLWVFGVTGSHLATANYAALRPPGWTDTHHSGLIHSRPAARPLVAYLSPVSCGDLIRLRSGHLRTRSLRSHGTYCQYHYRTHLRQCALLCVCMFLYNDYKILEEFV